MNQTATLRTALLATALALPAVPAAAASSTSSAASDSVSTSVGSVSGSLERSSGSSRDDRRAAAGDYTVVEVLAAAGRPGMARMKLRALADAEAEFFLYLPQPIADASGVEAGQVVTVSERAWGLTFARQAAQQPFFLVLDDAALRELKTTPVTAS